tara:strand:+ start:1015 stop:1161 length:147 start_codon:yes stop_codon:yes gene_type:complete
MVTSKDIQTHIDLLKETKTLKMGVMDETLDYWEEKLIITKEIEQNDKH